MTSLPAVIDVLERLVAFDTTSSRSNLALVEWVEAQLAPVAARITRLPDPTGAKANLWIRIGPDAPGGVVLSGHTDVVPVAGQAWTSDPWTLTRRDGRLYGRGTADMKGFLALAIAHAPLFARAGLSRPVHLAFSFDEEVGCAGVAPMIEAIADAGAAPALVWVGEPTLWGVVSGQKAIRTCEVVVTGKEGHSSAPAKGASAIHAAVDLLGVLTATARGLEAGQAPADDPFDPPHATLTVGLIRGGTAGNILARDCRFEFDLRTRAGEDAAAILAPFHARAAEIDRELARWGEGCGVRLTVHADAPGLELRADNAAEAFLREVTGDNQRRAVAYATEAGRFGARGFAAAICGPGSIDQAHQPDEWIDPAELGRGVELMHRLAGRLSG